MLTNELWQILATAGIIIGAMFVLALLALWVINLRHRRKKRTSVPNGTDRSEFAERLTQKYQDMRFKGKE